MSRTDNEPFTLSRDVDAVIVPAGINVKLRAGQSGFITQALGGSFTVYVEGNLFRVAGKDADALGKELAAVPELPPDASDADVRELAWSQMKGCYDPEIPINIVELGPGLFLRGAFRAGRARGFHRDDAYGARLRHGRSAGPGRA